MAKGWGGQSPWEGEADFNPLISDHSAPGRARSTMSDLGD